MLLLLLLLVVVRLRQNERITVQLSTCFATASSFSSTDSTGMNTTSNLSLELLSEACVSRVTLDLRGAMQWRVRCFDCLSCRLESEWTVSYGLSRLYLHAALLSCACCLFFQAVCGVASTAVVVILFVVFSTSFERIAGSIVVKPIDRMMRILRVSRVVVVVFTKLFRDCTLWGPVG